MHTVTPAVAGWRGQLRSCGTITLPSDSARSAADALQQSPGTHGGAAETVKGWLYKIPKVATLPNTVIDAFATVADVRLKPGYTLATALDCRVQAKLIVGNTRQIARGQAERRDRGTAPIAGGEVFKRLLDTTGSRGEALEALYRHASRYGRAMLTVTAANRQGVTTRCPAGIGRPAGGGVSPALFPFILPCTAMSEHAAWPPPPLPRLPAPPRRTRTATPRASSNCCCFPISSTCRYAISAR